VEGHPTIVDQKIDVSSQRHVEADLSSWKVPSVSMGDPRTVLDIAMKRNMSKFLPGFEPRTTRNQ
jgi:hypothetical protein